MLNLNLLPPDEQRMVQYELDRRIVSIFGQGLVAVGTIFMILLLPAYFFVSFQQGEVERSRTIEMESRQSAELTHLEKTVTSANEMIARLLDRASEHQVTSPFIADILSRAPAGVFISTLSGGHTSKQARLTGKAETRDAFLKLEASLRQSPFIADVSFSPDVILKESNVVFSLTITLP